MTARIRRGVCAALTRRQGTLVNAAVRRNRYDATETQRSQRETQVNSSRKNRETTPETGSQIFREIRHRLGSGTQTKRMS